MHPKKIGSKTALGGEIVELVVADNELEGALTTGARIGTAVPP
jgi:hypothetical protein